uniref:Structural maintenance of chromosomes protein 5 n=1 Tax=Leersia perrieri TaxID=77586 RepID=A0A0D9XTG6_9ORYZ
MATAKRARIDSAASSFSSPSTPPPQPPWRRGDDDYVPGNIVEIELCNFMTYARLTCRPGPRLNLVIGTNGSGKSSLVCAIALALAAEPNFLGRASSVGAFVKRGEESGPARISLRGYTPDQTISITRKIDTKNKSEWQIDGSTVPRKEVVDLIKKFNIQVNNLTLFLPQDRVCEFAKLTHIQLLEETEKAVGDPDLPVQHHQLIDRSKELKNLEVAVKQKEQTLNNLKALNAELEIDVERVRQRDKLLRKAELMRKRLPWLKYEIKNKEYIQAQEQEKTKKRIMEEAAKIWEGSKGPIEPQERENVHYFKCKKDKQPNSGKHEENEQLKATLENIDSLKRRENSRQQRILKAKEALAAAEREHGDLQPYEAHEAEMSRLTEKIVELTCAVKKLKEEGADTQSLLVRERVILRNCSDRLKKMENKNNKLLQKLKESGAEKIYEAYNWVQDNIYKFRNEVYGPVLLEVNIQDKVHASYLEGHVPKYIWKSFITQDSSDRDLLVRQLKRYDIPVLNYMGENGIRREPFNTTMEMQKVGIYARLDRVFEAPPAVKDVLYIGTNETHNRADDVPKLGLSDFWTPNSHYRWSRSRYGGHLSAFVDDVNPSRLFMDNLDVGDIERLQSQKDKHVKNLEEMNVSLEMQVKQQSQLEDEAAQIHKEKEEIIGMMRSEKERQCGIKWRVDMKRSTLENIYKEEDTGSTKTKFVDQVAKLNDEQFQAVLKLKDLLIRAVVLKRSCTQENMASIELDTKIWEAQKDVKKLERDAVLEDMKIMPTTIEELDSAIQDIESEANSMLFLNQNVLLEYQNRQHEIESISEKLEDDKGECQRCYSDIEITKGKWLPTLHTLVSKINSTFSRNFQEMAVAGEVSLDEHGLDYEQYGILIKANRPVAGVECSSPIWRGAISFYYLVSRMDPINERKMFQQLMRAASQPNTPQCFLLTPKLLSDLEFSDACNILGIMFGPCIDELAEAWSTGDNWRKLMADP